jgi:hypothetical protein
MAGQGEVDVRADAPSKLIRGVAQRQSEGAVVIGPLGNVM